VASYFFFNSKRIEISKTALGLVLIGLFAALLFAVHPARAAGWQPACAGPPPCAPQGDPIGAALISLHHNYDPNVQETGKSSFMTDANGNLSAAFVFGIFNHGPQVDGEATPNCSSGQFMSMTGCTTGPSGHQGKPNTCVGDPLNVLTGDHYEEVTDFTTRGADQFSLIRFYNSDLTYVNSAAAAYSGAISPYKSRFGIAWRSQYDRYIMDPSGLSTSSTRIDAVRSDGNPVHFAKSSGVWYVAYWNPATGAYSPSTDPRRNVDLRLTTDGTYWYVQDADNTVDKYDMSGKLVQASYRGGYSQSFTYDGSGNNTVITDSFSRTLTFTYLANGLVDTMTDPTTGVSHYAYVDRSGIGTTPPSGSEGLWVLVTVQYPDSTTLGYLYEDNTNWIIRPRSRPTMAGARRCPRPMPTASPPITAMTRGDG